MSRINHARANERSRIAQHGAESITDELPAGAFPLRRSKPKAEVRAEASAALEAITQRVNCANCGHSANVPLPRAWRGRALKCSACGAIAGRVE